MKKLKFFMAALLTLSVGVINVKAEEFGEIYQKLTTDGTLTITDTSLGSKQDLIYSTISKVKVEDNSWFGINSCNEDYTKCEIYYHSDIDSTKNETHTLAIKFEEKYSDFFKKITTDGNVSVPYTATDIENSTLIQMYLESFRTDDYSISSTCNDDYTICNVYVMKGVNNVFSFYESHNVNISFKEQYSDEFKKVTIDGNLNINSIKPKSLEEAESLLTASLSKYNTNDYEYYVGGCNETYTTCTVSRTELNHWYKAEYHKVNMNYVPVDKNIQSKVNELTTSLKDKKRFTVKDLDLINYIVNETNGKYDENFIYSLNSNAGDYSSELKQAVGNGNLKVILDARYGWGAGLYDCGMGGNLVVLHNDVAYGMLENIEIGRQNVIYVPDDTANTTEAFVAAAQKRINEYLGNDKVKIKYAGKLTQEDKDAYNYLVDIAKTNGEYYTLTYGKIEMDFLIQKDSSKIETKKEHSTNDIITNITISTESSSIPLDTTIKVEEIVKEDKKFTEITKKLDVKQAIVYDLKLYSSTNKNYISKLEDGAFKVSIPVPEALKNIKNLSAYYIQDDGTIEEYPADPEEIKKGNVVFNTKHFSIYTIAESGKSKTTVTEKNPATFDGITNYIFIGVISLIGLCVGVISLRKENLN